MTYSFPQSKAFIVRHKESPWCPRSGWHDLIPGLSKLEDAINNLGPYDNFEKIVNATIYKFVNQTVEIIVLADKTVITSIRVYANFPVENFLPRSLGEARMIVDNLEQTSIDEFAIAIHEAPGVRIASELFGDNPAVKWLEFHEIAE